MPTREELLFKLRNKINNKRNNNDAKNPQHMAKMSKEFKKKVNEINKDERITSEMLNRYQKAIVEFPNNNIVNPKCILDNYDKYKKEYDNYILTSIKTAKTKGLGINSIRSMIDNSYTQYMTHVLDIPQLPFQL